MERNKMVDLLYAQRIGGAGFSELRKQLEEQKVAEHDIKQLLAAVNERELQNLKIPKSFINPLIFLVLSLLTLSSALLLSYFLNRTSIPNAYYFLNAIPVIGAAILYHQYRQNRKKVKK